uniref:HDC07770 n=1 Tax=Drosophila melanogaster TaxID=7227 RepID=Q6IM20_DROME|nr:TPA_inf: HDC07770 [Drosophila melanogaster]
MFLRQLSGMIAAKVAGDRSVIADDRKKICANCVVSALRSPISHLRSPAVQFARVDRVRIAGPGKSSKSC